MQNICCIHRTHGTLFSWACFIYGKIYNSDDLPSESKSKSTGDWARELACTMCGKCAVRV